MPTPLPGKDEAIEQACARYGTGMSAESREDLHRELNWAREKFYELDRDHNGVLDGEELQVSSLSVSVCH
jgi:hypothetical protein